MRGLDVYAPSFCHAQANAATAAIRSGRDPLRSAPAHTAFLSAMRLGSALSTSPALGSLHGLPDNRVRPDVSKGSKKRVCQLAAKAPGALYMTDYRTPFRGRKKKESEGGGGLFFGVLLRLVAPPLAGVGIAVCGHQWTGLLAAHALAGAAMSLVEVGECLKKSVSWHICAVH